MSESVIIEFGVDDKGTPVLKNVTDSIRGVNDEASKGAGSLGKMGESSNKAGSSAGKLNGAMVMAGASIAAAAAAAAAAGVALMKMGQFALASVEAFREQDDVNRRLERSLQRAGQSGAEFEASLSQINGAIGNLAVETNFGDEELSRMASTFIQLSGSSTATQKDLELIADIAAETGQSGEAAAQMYANALEGQLRPSLARTTSLTEEQIKAINETEDQTERARLAQEALAEAYGGAAKDINPLFKATKNLEDAQGDLMQMIGGVISESGAFAPVLDVLTSAFRRVESFVDENRVAIQTWLIDAVLMGVEAVQGFIGKLTDLSPVFALLVEYIQQVGRNFSIFMSSINIVIRSVVAFNRAIQAGIVRALGKALEAGIAVAEFFGKDIPPSVRMAQRAINDFGDSIEEDMQKHLDSAGDSADNIRQKIEESGGAMGRVIERSASMSGMLNMAGNAAQNLADRLNESRRNVQGLRDESVEAAEEIQEVSVAVSGGGGGAGEGAGTATPTEEVNQAEIDHRNLIASMKMAEYQVEDERMRAILVAERERYELAQEDLTLEEQRLGLYEIEQRLADSLRQQDQQDHQRRMSQLEAERQARQDLDAAKQQARQQEMNDNIALFGQLDAQVGGLGTLIASFKTLRDVGFETEESYEAMVSALGAVTSIGSGLAGLITEDREKAAKIEAAFNAAAAIGAFAAYAASGFTAAPLGIAAAQHAIAAAQFAYIGGGGGGAKGGGGGATASGGGGGRTARDAQALDRGRDQGVQPLVINYNLNGTFLETSDSIARRLDNSVESSQRNRFVAGRGRMERG